MVLSSAPDMNGDTRQGECQDPPRRAGLPVLGNAPELLRDTGALLVDCHRTLGPVFSLRVLWKKYVVIAGEAARDFIRERLDEKHCSRGAIFDPIEREFGKGDLTLAHTGERHARLRPPLSIAYSRQVASPFVPALVDAVRGQVRGWTPGAALGVMKVLPRLAFEQYVRALAGDVPGLRYRDCQMVTDYGMNVGGQLLPVSIFRLPWYRAAHRRAFAALGRLVAERRASRLPPATATPPTILDTLLGVCDASGKPLTDDEVLTYAAYGVAASCAYVARLTGFMLYEILRDPGLLGRLTAEVDRSFEDGLRDATDVRRMGLLRGVYEETLRFHPISPGMPFQVEEEFVYLGKRIRRGDLLVVSPVPEAFSACPFHRPDAFDASRFSGAEDGSRLRAAYHPFGLGHRACVATGLVELMAMTTIATLLYDRHLVLDPPGYRLGLVVRPLPAPDRRFRVRVEERKLPVPGPAPARRELPEEMFATFPGHDDPIVAGVLRSAVPRAFSPGMTILREGDPADAFHVLTRGTVTVTRDGVGEPQLLAQLGLGDFFGEIGLLQGMPRNANVIAGADGADTLEIGREGFFAIVASADLLGEEIGRLARRRIAAMHLRGAIPEFDPAAAAHLLPEFSVREYGPGEAAVREGEPAEEFFILIRGEVRVSRRSGEGGEEELARLTPGEYFGETGLLVGAPRNATVAASSEGGAAALVTDRAGFERLLEAGGGGRGELARAMLTRLRQREGGAGAMAGTNDTPVAPGGRRET